MKRTLLAFIAILSIFAVVSCNNDTPQIDSYEKKTPTCQEIMASVIESFSINTDEFDYFSYAEEEKRLDEMSTALFYGDMESGQAPDFSHVADYYILTPVTTTATEIGVFKLDSAQNTEYIKKCFETRANTRATIFAAYNEAEAKKAQNALISMYEEYVWYIITDNNEDINSKIVEKVY